MSPRTPPEPDEYTVVGCSNCDNLQIVQGAPKTTGCKRCGKRLTFKKLKQFYRTTDKSAAQNARAIKLAARNDDAEQFRQLLESGDLDEAAARAVTDDEFLQKKGIDPSSVGSDESLSPVEAVEDSIETLDAPTPEEIVAYTDDEYDVVEADTREAIDKLRQRGDIIQKADGSIRTL